MRRLLFGLRAMGSLLNCWGFTGGGGQGYEEGRRTASGRESSNFDILLTVPFIFSLDQLPVRTLRPIC